MTSPAVGLCARCNTELAAGMLSCPACSALVHADELKHLAAAAGELAEQGKLGEARATWYRALTLLPPTTQQYATIRQRIAELGKRIDSAPAAQLGEPAERAPWWKRGAAAAITAVLFALGKLKFLILGLGKASTLLSMFAFFAVYWGIFGWPFAAGLVICIYIHEMGHVWALRSEGIAAGAPLFIPGIGALVLLKQHIDDPKVDAKIGLAGPLWGLGAGLAAYVVFRYTGLPIWGAIARGAGYLNLFNLLPVWQLDGSRGFHALSRWQRWAVVGALAIAWLATQEGILIIIGMVAIYRALQKAVDEPDNKALTSFIVLIGALGWLSSITVTR
ncbi:MAG: site-2 protease family protein [Gemmatimonadota bacterium]|nr:site-2 protease family protein [Gemmatimonadota bacterium]